MFDIDKVRADLPRNRRGGDVTFDELLDLPVAEHLRVAGDVELLVENWMPIRHARLQTSFVIRFAESAGVRELKTDDEVVRVPAAFLVRANENLTQFGQILPVFLDDDKLVRVRASVGTDGHRFAPVNQLRTALAEALPAPADFLRSAPRRRAVPAFHRLDGPAIADALAVDCRSVDR